MKIYLVMHYVEGDVDAFPWHVLVTEKEEVAQNFLKEKIAEIPSSDKWTKYCIEVCENEKIKF